MSAEVVSAGAAVVAAAITVPALIVAIRADRHAKHANQLASEANRLAQESAAAASKSADEAEDANELARVADERAQRAEARATSRNDVVFRTRVDDQRSLVIRNDGLDTARDVNVTITVLKQRRSYSIGDCEPGVDVIVASLAQDVTDRQWQARTLNSEFAQKGIAYSATTAFKIDQRIVWRDEAGGWHGIDLEAQRVG